MESGILLYSPVPHGQCGWEEVVDEMAVLLAPPQLGYGIRNGAETAVHAARIHLSNLDPCYTYVVLKLDFHNAR